MRCARFSFVVAALLAACADPGEPGAVDRGKALFTDPRLSSSPSNPFSCSTCHEIEAGRSPLRKPGAPLAGVTLRPLFWGGQENDLLSAVNACLRHFMISTTPLTEDDPRARDLYAFLESLEPGDANPVPFTLPRTIEDVPRVPDTGEGELLYGLACLHCHGVRATGAGRLSPVVPVLPDQTIAEHPGYTPRLLRLVFIEKTRHGVFFGYGGSMPPFSVETLSDTELALVLEYLGMGGQ